MSDFEFQKWPKTPRLFRDMIITEKIDGTNACVYVSDDGLTVGAQSRNKIITPDQDNAGFARWVYDNAGTLSADLGPGYHFGEWWGQGIQRGYGLDHRRFSLFNTHRWADAEFHTENLGVVPVLEKRTFNSIWVQWVIGDLKVDGSIAAPGFMNPEGVMVYLTASNQVYKVLIENDELPKGVAA